VNTLLPCFHFPSNVLRIIFPWNNISHAGNFADSVKIEYFLSIPSACLEAKQKKHTPSFEDGSRFRQAIKGKTDRKKIRGAESSTHVNSSPKNFHVRQPTYLQSVSCLLRMHMPYFTPTHTYIGAMKLFFTSFSLSCLPFASGEFSPDFGLQKLGGKRKGENFSPYIQASFWCSIMIWCVYKCVPLLVPRFCKVKQLLIFS